MDVRLPFFEDSCWIKFLISLKDWATWMPVPLFEFSPGLMIQILLSFYCSNCLYALVNLLYSESPLCGDLILKVRGIATSKGLIPMA